jgi:hypothetical protein
VATTPAAGDLAERHLRRLPVTNRTERIAALELKVRACVEQGRSTRRGPRCAELARIADESHTAPLRARASFVAGLVAARAGDANVARTHLEDAVDLFSASGAPFETGRPAWSSRACWARSAVTSAARPKRGAPSTT